MLPPVKRRHSLLALTLALGTAATLASTHLVDLKWDASGAFRHAGRIEPGRFVEVCGPLAAGSAVQWRYEASAPLEFNIHYHQGNDVVYPAKLDRADKAADRLAVTVAQDYCWMWTNKTAAAVTVTVNLRRE